MDFVKMAEDNAKVEYLLVNGLPVDDNFLRLNADDCDLLPPSMRTVTGGRLPEKDGELVINSANAEQWGYPEIGSTVNAELFVCGVKTGAETPAGTPMILAENFDITEIREISFTVVGYSDTINMVSYNDTQLKSYNYLSDNLVARFSDSANDLRRHRGAPKPWRWFRRRAARALRLVPSSHLGRRAPLCDRAWAQRCAICEKAR